MNLNLRKIYYLCLSILLIFAFFQAVNELRIGYYETVHRLSLYTIMEVTLFPGELDKLAILLLSLFLVILQLFMKRNRQEKPFLRYLPPSLMVLALITLYVLNESVAPFLMVIVSNILYLKMNLLIQQYFNFALTLMIIFFSISLVRWLTYPFLKTEPYSDLSWIPSKIEKTIFYFFNSTLSPYLVTMLMLSWLIGLVLIPIRRVKRVRITRRCVQLSVRTKIEGEDIEMFAIGPSSTGLYSYLLDEKVAFIFSFASLLFLSYYPYFPSLNPSGRPASVDILYNYVPTVERFESLGFTDRGIRYLFSASASVRPLITLSLFFLKNFSGLTYVDTIKFSLFLATYLLVISTYYSLKMITDNIILSTISIYFTTFSIQTIVGLYAGYLAMWVSASFQLLALAFLVNAFEHGKLKKLIPAISFSFLALLSHLWSWFIFSLMALVLLPIYLLISRLRIQSGPSKRQIMILVIFFSSQIFPDLLRQLIFTSPPTFDLLYSAYRWGKGSIVNLFLYNRNLQSTLQTYVGGFTNNCLIYIFSIVGVLSTWKNNRFLQAFILSALLVTCPAFFLFDYRPQSRILFFLPLPIFTTIGLYEILRVLRGKADVDRSFCLVALILSNYAFRSVANLI